MKEKIIKTIPATPELSVILYECADPRKGCYISIKHNEEVVDMKSEVLTIPEDTPALIKALSEAAIILTQSANYHGGFTDGLKEK